MHEKTGLEGLILCLLDVYYRESQWKCFDCKEKYQSRIGDLKVLAKAL